MGEVHLFQPGRAWEKGEKKKEKGEEGREGSDLFLTSAFRNIPCQQLFWAQPPGFQRAMEILPTPPIFFNKKAPSLE